jgi:hypothetical protein
MRPTVERTHLADALQAAGVRPGTPWWSESGATSARGVGVPAAASGDWFAQHAPRESASTIRMYHGGANPDLNGPAWFSSDPAYAKGYADKSGGAVSYVDVPADHPLLAPEYPEQGIAQGFHRTVELPAELARHRQPLAESGGNGPRVPIDDGLGGNGGEPPFSSGGFPPARPLTATQVADESFLSKLPDDIRGTLRKVWTEYGGFEDQRRSVQPLDRTQALADRLTLPESLPAGATLNAEGVTHAYDALIAKEREFSALDPKVKAGTVSDAEWLRHRELETERVLAAERVRGVVAESGRSLRAIRAKVEELKAVQIAQQSDNPGLQQEVRAALSRGTLSNYFRNYLYGNLVSGVATQERNLIGNVLQLGNDIAADVVTAKPGHAGRDGRRRTLRIAAGAERVRARDAAWRQRV